MRYFINTPWWVKKLWPSYIWSIDTKEKIIYLSFDDGPHPIATPFVLDQLKKYGARGTFFCIGKNVKANPHLFNRILNEGHATGNHTWQHLNGWKTANEIYLKDIADADELIHSGLFRPPDGRLRSSQARNLKTVIRQGSPKVIMWSVLSGDFDESISKEQCLRNATRVVKPGSIIVFHDSEKAFSRLAYTLPRLLEFYSEKGYLFEKIRDSDLT